MMKKFLAFFIAIAIIIIFIFGGEGCAVIVPPTGGAKDTLPPVVVRVHPENKTLHFKDNKITFNFDEYVELNDAFKNLMISPVPKIFPEVQRKLKTVSIKLKDTLQQNTTYVFNFKDAIKDVNEGNAIKNLLYVVSTGNFIDSMELSGNVKLAKTAKPDSTLIVMLHTNLDDSAVVKEKPKYVAKLDSSGTFLFRYLAPGKYRLYALKDESGAYMYTSKEQLFAFADSPVVISSIPPNPILLYAYNEEEKKPEGQTPEPDKKEKRLKYKTNQESNKQNLLEPFIMTFESPLKIFDSSKMVLTDTAYKKIDGYKYSLDSTKTILTMNMKWTENTDYRLLLAKDFASDTLGRQLLKGDTLNFASKALKEYGKVKIDFKTLDFSKNPVLLIVQGDKVKNAYPITKREFELQFYPPGDYELQILYDRNKNNKWDPGIFFGKHQQPELIVPLDRKLNVKPDWTTEFELK
ncbi:MAG TPA: Ig-like domain-containing domain [Niabella sp.]|jgi:hypothetical protein|nr:Ig-like domain-containing domain [Chitinophagaceae bacterium]HRN46446.1 Ig-like domain-containing domain [Niabella sp.]HRO84383.1 Ig-like domain-containing domain [Niabella sp.]